MRNRRVGPPVVEVHIETLVVEGADLSRPWADRLGTALRDTLGDELVSALRAPTYDGRRSPRPALLEDLVLRTGSDPGAADLTGHPSDAGRHVGRALAGELGPRVGGSAPRRRPC